MYVMATEATELTKIMEVLASLCTPRALCGPCEYPGVIDAYQMRF